MKQQTFSFKLSDNTKQEIIQEYEYTKLDKTPPYAVFQAKEADTTITLYESGKVVFQGISADIDAKMWMERENFLNNSKISLEKKEEKKQQKDNIDFYFISSIGSDEVGTGDYFGPIIVTASYVNKKDIPFLEELGVRDSKKINDEKIKKIAKEIIDKIPHVTVILPNTKYNDNYTNMNKLKAILHNKALYLLLNNNFQYDMIVMDQFVNKFAYFNYLKGNKELVKNIVFTTKAEDKCLSVACSSIISRYKFLEEMDKLEKEIGMTIPKGASNIVDEAGIKIVTKYGKDKLRDIAKLNFKNTEKILNSIR